MCVSGTEEQTHSEEEEEERRTHPRVSVQTQAADILLGPAINPSASTAHGGWGGGGGGGRLHVISSKHTEGGGLQMATRRGEGEIMDGGKERADSDCQFSMVGFLSFADVGQAAISTLHR